MRDGGRLLACLIGFLVFGPVHADPLATALGAVLPHYRHLAAMQAGRSMTLRLIEPVPVVIAYLTAVVAADGRVQFLPDLYGLDKLQ